MADCYCVFRSDNSETTQSTSKTTASAGVNCSPSWIVYPKTYVAGAGRALGRPTTLQQCLGACVADLRCIAVYWRDSTECFLYYSHSAPRHNPTFRPTLFELIRPCDRTSGFRFSFCVFLCFHYDFDYFLCYCITIVFCTTVLWVTVSARSSLVSPAHTLLYYSTKRNKQINKYVI